MGFPCLRKFNGENILLIFTNCKYERVVSCSVCSCKQKYTNNESADTNTQATPETMLLLQKRRRFCTIVS